MIMDNLVKFKFEKISKYLEIPIFDHYSLISEPIFSAKVPDYFFSSFFLGYIYEISKSQTSDHLTKFITLYAQTLLPCFDKYEHKFQKDLPIESLNFLQKLKRKLEREELIEYLDFLREKKKEISFIVKVALFYFLKMSKNPQVKKNRKKYMKKLLHNKEIPLDSTYFSFLSEAFRLNIVAFSEEDAQGEPQRYSCQQDNEEDKGILTLGFLIDVRKRLRILTKEHTLPIEKIVPLKKEKLGSQKFFNSSAKNDLLKSVENMMVMIENIQNNLEKSEMPDLFSKKENHEICGPLEEIKDTLKSVSDKLKILEFNDDEKSQEDQLSTIANHSDVFIMDEVFKIPEFECPICCNSVTMDEVFSFGCGHKFCMECLKMALLTKYNNLQCDLGIDCFNGDCSYKMDEFNSKPIFISFLGKEKVDIMCKRLAIAKERDVIRNQCPHCKENYIRSYNWEAIYKCNKCGVDICLKCGELKHEEKICKKVIEQMKDFLNLDKYDDSVIRCCPVCFEFIIKNKNSDDHVICFMCNTEFCFNCSALQEPILKHGNQYHRRGCIYFRKWIDPWTKIEILEDKIEPKCKECQKNNEVCKRPKLDVKSFYHSFGMEIDNANN